MSKVKLLVYVSAILGSLAIYLAWQEDVLPDDIQRFVGAYGLHGLGTFGYTAFLGLFLIGFQKKRSMLALLAIMVTAFVISSFNEAAQYFNPERVMDFWDFIAQTLGVLVGGSLTYFLGPITLRDCHD